MSRTTCRTCRQPVALSPRETDVLRGLANGATNIEVATTLCISPKTVDSHIRAMVELLGVEHPANRLRLLTVAASLGLVPRDTRLGRVVIRQLWAELPTEVLF